MPIFGVVKLSCLQGQLSYITKTSNFPLQCKYSVVKIYVENLKICLEAEHVVCVPSVPLTYY